MTHDADGFPESILSFADGDPRAATLLRANLTGLRDLLARDDGPATDPEAARALSAAIGDVLAGRESMRSLAEDPALASLAEAGMRQAQDAWWRLSPEQRAAEVRAGSSHPSAE